QVERSPSQHVPDRVETAGAAILRGGRHGISRSEAEQRAQETSAQPTSRGERRGGEERVGFATGRRGPPPHVLDLCGGFRHRGPQARAGTLSPQTIQLLESLLTGEALLDEQTTRHHPRAANAGAAVQVNHASLAQRTAQSLEYRRHLARV